jgi:hypothetical protein
VSARSRRSSDDDDAFDDHAFVAGERIGRPLPRGGRKVLLRGSLLLLVAGAAGWALMGGGTSPTEWVSRMAAAWRSIEPAASAFNRPAVSAMTAASGPSQSEQATQAAAFDRAPPGPLPPSRAFAPAPPEAKPEPPPPLTTAALPPPPAKADPPPEPLRPARADPSDPKQMRAAAIGLHPGVSPVLLARLTPTDYRNGAFAIRTALKDTPDGAVFAWPRQRTPELALFKVRFVAGAAPGCRRYVVTVVKDGWLTTAPAMEKCGAEGAAARRG